MSLDSLFKGWQGELKTKLTDSLFLDERYKVFNSVLIHTDRGSTQIDHVIVSEYGLFVIETKDKTGWIFGDPKNEQWTQVIYGKKFHFQNPLRQNYLHTKTLSEILKIEHDKIHSIVVFWGDCEFKSSMPDNVFKGGFLGNRLKDYVHNKQISILSSNEVERICSSLTNVKNSEGLLSGFKHAKELRDKYGSNTTCPKCGGELVRRYSNKYQGTGKSFLGCSNYPRCHYIKDK